MKTKWPEWCLYALVASLPFDRIPSTVWLGIRVRPSLVLGVIFIVSVAIAYPWFWKPTTLVMKLLYGFLAVCVVSSLLSSYRVHSLTVTAETVFVAVLAMAVARLVPQIKWSTLLGVLMASTTVVILFGFYQFFGDLAGLSIHLTGLTPPYTAQVFGFPRIQAASLEPLYFANYLLLPISVAIALVSGLVGWLFVMAAALTLLLTLSRGGVAAFGLMFVPWVVRLSLVREYKRIAILVGTLGVSVGLTVVMLSVVVPALYKAPVHEPALSAYTDQVSNYDLGTKLDNRPYTRHVAMEAFYAHPLLGVGPGNYGRYLHLKNSLYPQSQTANNEPAELLGETGAIGFAAFVAFLLALAWAGVRRYLVARGAEASVACALMIYLAGVIVQYYSFSTLYIPVIWVGIGLLMGLAQHRSRQSHAAV